MTDVAPKTLADELREENARLQRRLIHHTRPRRLLTMDEARALAERMAATVPDPARPAESPKE